MVKAQSHDTYMPSAGWFPFTSRWSVLLLFATALLCGSVYAQTDRRDAEREDEQKQNRETPVLAGEAAIEVPVVDSVYIVGPGDMLTISIFATQYYNYTLPVHSDGTIVVPMIGKVDIRKSTLLEVRQLLRELLRREVRSGEILVSLYKPRKVKVTVSGAIRKPGVVILPATARVSEALDMTGGEIKDTTSLRNIVVRGPHGVRAIADLQRFYRIGDLDANPFVNSGDVIYFPKKDMSVGVFGAVNNSGWMDYKPGETLRSAIEVCQGLKAAAFLDSIEIVRFNPDHITTSSIHLSITNYDTNPNADIELQPKDLVLIREIPQFRRHDLIVIEGEVNYEGSYSILEGTTKLSDIIEQAGGFTADASLEEASITRRTDETERDKEFERLKQISPADMQEDEYEYFKARSRERVGQMVVNFKKLFLANDTTEDLYLRDGDYIEIPKLKNYIRVIGRVNNPGNIIFTDEWIFEDYITAAGGYGWRAEDGDVRVIKARTGELVDAEDYDDYSLEPGDTIWVPEEPEVKFWEIALEGLGVLSQIAGILGIVIAVSRIN
ncbi:MAG: hypothetical protein CL946_13785 [Ectothiorhodospiraceae bacterium]|nr:hypothetical protein [Ectothiorhodospiraceae bacterium]